MDCRLCLALLFVTAVGAVSPLGQRSVLESHASGLDAENAALSAPSAEFLRHKRDNSDRRFTSLRHLAKNLAVMKSQNAKDLKVWHTNHHVAASGAAASSETGHHASEDRLDAVAQKWQTNSKSAGTTRHHSKSQQPAAQSEDSRPVREIAQEGAASMKAKMKDNIQSMHTALHESERDIAAQARGEKARKEQAQAAAKKFAEEARNKALEERKREAVTETLRARAGVANKKFEEQKAQNQQEREKREAATVAHDQMVAYRIAQREERETKEKHEAEEAAKKAAKEAEEARQVKEKAANQAEEARKVAVAEQAKAAKANAEHAKAEKAVRTSNTDNQQGDASPPVHSGASPTDGLGAAFLTVLCASVL